MGNGRQRVIVIRDSLGKFAKGGLSPKRGLTYEEIYGKERAREVRKSLSGAKVGHSPSIEHRKSLSEATLRWFENNEHPMKGRQWPEETKQKISKSLKGKICTLEELKKRSATRQGIPLEDWQGFVSFEPYCPRFNLRLKEAIRNRDNRVCVKCGKSEILNGERLSVHHIDGEKMQGCNGVSWYLCSLCRSCNSLYDTPEKEFLIVSNMEVRRDGNT